MSFGEGIADIYTYFSSPDKPLDSIYKPFPRDGAFFHSIYFIKGDHILSLVPSDTNTIHSSENKSAEFSTSISAKISHPKYLVYWNDQMIYYLFKGWDGKNCASPNLLKDDLYDIFYRHLLLCSDSSIVIDMDSTSTVIINDKKCYKATFHTSIEKSGVFYYTKDSMSVKSPLNVYLGKTFPYNVMAIKFLKDWNEKGVKNYTVLHQIGRIKACHVESSLTTLSDSTVIRKEENLFELMSYPNPNQVR